MKISSCFYGYLQYQANRVKSYLSKCVNFSLSFTIALEKCTMLEAAQELGISVEACKKRVQRARKKLQKYLKE